MISARAFVFCVLAAAMPAFAAGFKVVDSTIDAAPNQQIVVLATGTDQVQGMDLTVEVQGAPLAITDMTITGSIWAENSLEPAVFVYPSEGFPNAQYGVLYVITVSGTVTASGVAATLIVDATGLEGQTAVITANYHEAPSDWAGVPVDGYEDGTITIRSSEPPAGNEPPVVNAGPDQAVTAGDVVSLSGTASDPEEEALTYLWLQIAGENVVLSSATIPNPTFTAPEVPATTLLEFQFRASDGTNTRTDSVVITINPRPDDGAPDGDDPDELPPPEDPPPPPSDDQDEEENDGGANDDTTEPLTDTPDDPSTDYSAVTPSDTNPPAGGDQNSAPSAEPQVSDESADPPSATNAGAPACAMGIAEAALLACAGLSIMFLRSRRRV